MSAFDKAGLTVTFGGGHGVIQKRDGTVVLTARLAKGMYVVDELNNLPGVLIAYLGRTSLSHPTSLEQWHRRLMHCSYESPLGVLVLLPRGLLALM